MTDKATFEEAVKGLLNLTNRIYDSEEFDLAVEALEDSLEFAPEGPLAEACRNVVALTRVVYAHAEMEDAIAEVLKARNLQQEMTAGNDR